MGRKFCKAKKTNYFYSKVEHLEHSRRAPHLIQGHFLWGSGEQKEQTFFCSRRGTPKFVKDLVWCKSIGLISLREIKATVYTFSFVRLLTTLIFHPHIFCRHNSGWHYKFFLFCEAHQNPNQNIHFGIHFHSWYSHRHPKIFGSFLFRIVSSDILSNSQNQRHKISDSPHRQEKVDDNPKFCQKFSQ